MKKVLLTENEYKKVCSILNESPMMELDDEEVGIINTHRANKANKFNKKNVIVVEFIDATNYKEYIGKVVKVKGDVNLKGLGLVVLPITFFRVYGDFDISGNNLKSIENFPIEIDGDLTFDEGVVSKNEIKNVCEVNGDVVENKEEKILYHDAVKMFNDAMEIEYNKMIKNKTLVSFVKKLGFKGIENKSVYYMSGGFGFNELTAHFIGNLEDEDESRDVIDGIFKKCNGINNVSYDGSPEEQKLMSPTNDITADCEGLIIDIYYYDGNFGEITLYDFEGEELTGIINDLYKKYAENDWKLYKEKVNTYKVPKSLIFRDIEGGKKRMKEYFDLYIDTIKKSNTL